MTVVLAGFNEAYFEASRWGTVTGRTATWARVGGESEYRLTIAARDLRRERIEEMLEDMVGGYLSDYEMGWRGRIVAIDLRSGHQNYRASGIESGDRMFANIVRVQYAGGSYQSASDGTSRARWGVWQKMIIDDSLASAEATELADSELQRYKDLPIFPTSTNVDWAETPTVTVTAWGLLPYEFRTPNVGDGTYGTDITGLSDQQIDTVLDAIITNDTGLTVGSIAANTDTVSTSELDGLNNNWARIEYLVSRVGSDGTIYQCRVDESDTFFYEAIDDNAHTLHRGYVTGPTGTRLMAHECRPGNWRDSNTGYTYVVNEIEATPGASIPRLIEPGYEAWGSMGGGSSSAPAPGGDNSNQIPDGGIFIPGPTGNRWPGYRVPMSERGG